MNALPVEAKMILAGGALLVAGLVGFMLSHTFSETEIAKLNEDHTKELNVALDAKLKAETRVHGLEDEGRKATTAALTAYDETHQNEKATADRTIDDLRNDVKRLRVSTTRGTSGGGMCPTGPSTSADHGEADETLTGSVAARLAGRYADYNEVVGQLDLCQGQLLRDRKITAPPAE